VASLPHHPGDKAPDFELPGTGGNFRLSAQDITSHEQFIANHRLRLPLLSDVELEVSRAYGVHSRLLGTKRATFVIDANGIVRYRHDHLLSLTYDSVDDLRKAVAESRADER
jgi:peroxiredoxin Q/BCP